MFRVMQHLGLPLDSVSYENPSGFSDSYRYGCPPGTAPGTCSVRRIRLHSRHKDEIVMRVEADSESSVC